jgi:hypothetical protein
MGHSSIQATVDTYGQLIPGADVSFVDRLDGVAEPKAETNWQQSATPAQLDEVREIPGSPEVADLIGGGGRTRTYDLRIMSHPTGADSKQLQQDTCADSGKSCKIRTTRAPKRTVKCERQVPQREPTEQLRDTNWTLPHAKKLAAPNAKGVRSCSTPSLAFQHLALGIRRSQKHNHCRSHFP